MTVIIRPEWRRLIDAAPPKRQAWAYLQTWCMTAAAEAVDDEAEGLALAAGIVWSCRVWGEA